MYLVRLFLIIYFNVNKSNMFHSFSQRMHFRQKVRDHFLLTFILLLSSAALIADTANCPNGGLNNVHLNTTAAAIRAEPLDPCELQEMSNPISEFYDDPLTRRLEVVMRMCSDLRHVLSGDGTRPPWFTKERAFRSMFLTKGDNVYVTVLFDGDSTGHWINNYPVNVVPIEGGDGDSSFLALLDFIRSQSYPDNTIIYCLEDDYLHRPGWHRIVREGFMPLMPSTLRFDYITLYDHKDKYTYDMYHDLTSKIGISASVHWRTVPSTTNTWITLSKTLKEDFEVFWTYRNQDHEKFLYLGRQGRTIGSCIPGYSTHAHVEHLSPFYDWSEDHETPPEMRTL